jgi:hypothetical protein
LPDEATVLIRPTDVPTRGMTNSPLPFLLRAQ